MSMYIGCSFTFLFFFFFRSWWSTGQKVPFWLRCGAVVHLWTSGWIKDVFFFCFVFWLLFFMQSISWNLISVGLTFFSIMFLCSNVESVSNENNLYLRFITVWDNFWAPLFCLDTLHRISLVLHHVQTQDIHTLVLGHGISFVFVFFLKEWCNEPC